MAANTETAELTNDIMNALSERGSLCSRNNTGSVIKTYRKKGALADSSRRIKFGVGLKDGGGGDIIGLRNPDGKFFSIEVKTGADEQTEVQAKWERFVKMRGGIAGVCRSVQDAIDLVYGG